MSNGVTGFEPIDNIQFAFHAYSAAADDPEQRVESYHFCTGANEDGVYQSLIFDSPGKNAKLIGIEYLITEEIFESLPEEEKGLWHSHKHEVASGLIMPLKPTMPGATVSMVKRTVMVRSRSDIEGTPTQGSGGLVATDRETEREQMQLLYKLYGKIIHTWHPPASKIPLGAPRLMSLLSDEETQQICVGRSGQLLEDNPLDTRDRRHAANTRKSMERRASYLDQEYEPAEGAGTFKDGKVRQLSFTSMSSQKLSFTAMDPSKPSSGSGNKLTQHKFD